MTKKNIFEKLLLRANLYKQVLKIELPWLDNVVHAKSKKYIPVVFTRDEVKRLLAQFDGAYWLLFSLIYGAGLHISECGQGISLAICFPVSGYRHRPAVEGQTAASHL